MSEPAPSPRRPGHPRVAVSGAVVAILRALVTEGRRTLTIADLAREVAARVPCSRSSAYRLLRRAVVAGLVRLPGYCLSG